MQIDLETKSALLRYHLLNQSIAPRPIVWVSTVDKLNCINLAPYDFFAPLSIDPIIFAISFFPKTDGGSKDTYKNIKTTARASVCICEADMLHSVHRSGVETQESESEVLGIDMREEIEGYPPIPRGVRVAFMCDFSHEIEVSKYNKVLLLEAKRCYLEDNLYTRELDFKLDTIARRGKSYETRGESIPQDEVD